MVAYYVYLTTVDFLGPIVQLYRIWRYQPYAFEYIPPEWWSWGFVLLVFAILLLIPVAIAYLRVNHRGMVKLLSGLIFTDEFWQNVVQNIGYDLSNSAAVPALVVALVAAVLDCVVAPSSPVELEFELKLFRKQAVNFTAGGRAFQDATKEGMTRGIIRSAGGKDEQLLRQVDATVGDSGGHHASGMSYEYAIQDEWMNVPPILGLRDDLPEVAEWAYNWAQWTSVLILWMYITVILFCCYILVYRMRPALDRVGNKVLRKQCTPFDGDGGGDCFRLCGCSARDPDSINDPEERNAVRKHINQHKDSYPTQQLAPLLFELQLMVLCTVVPFFLMWMLQSTEGFFAFVLWLGCTLLYYVSKLPVMPLDPMLVLGAFVIAWAIQVALDPALYYDPVKHWVEIAFALAAVFAVFSLPTCQCCRSKARQHPQATPESHRTPQWLVVWVTLILVCYANGLTRITDPCIAGSNFRLADILYATGHPRYMIGIGIFCLGACELAAAELGEELGSNCASKARSWLSRGEQLARDKKLRKSWYDAVKEMFSADQTKDWTDIVATYLGGNVSTDLQALLAQICGSLVEVTIVAAVGIWAVAVGRGMSRRVAKQIREIALETATATFHLRNQTRYDTLVMNAALIDTPLADYDEYKSFESGEWERYNYVSGMASLPWGGDAIAALENEKGPSAVIVSSWSVLVVICCIFTLLVFVVLQTMEAAHAAYGLFNFVPNVSPKQVLVPRLRRVNRIRGTRGGSPSRRSSSGNNIRDIGSGRPGLVAFGGAATCSHPICFDSLVAPAPDSAMVHRSTFVAAGQRVRHLWELFRTFKSDVAGTTFRLSTRFFLRRVLETSVDEVKTLSSEYSRVLENFQGGDSDSDSDYGDASDGLVESNRSNAMREYQAHTRSHVRRRRPRRSQGRLEDYSAGEPEYPVANASSGTFDDLSADGSHCDPELVGAVAPIATAPSPPPPTGLAAYGAIMPSMDAASADIASKEEQMLSLLGGDVSALDHDPTLDSQAEDEDVYRLQGVVVSGEPGVRPLQELLYSVLSSEAGPSGNASEQKAGAFGQLELIMQVDVALENMSDMELVLDHMQLRVEANSAPYENGEGLSTTDCYSANMCNLQVCACMASWIARAWSDIEKNSSKARSLREDLLEVMQQLSSYIAYDWIGSSDRQECLGVLLAVETIPFDAASKQNTHPNAALHRENLQEGAEDADFFYGDKANPNGPIRPNHTRGDRDLGRNAIWRSDRHIVVPVASELGSSIPARSDVSEGISLGPNVAIGASSGAGGESERPRSIADSMGASRPEHGGSGSEVSNDRVPIHLRIVVDLDLLQALLMKQPHLLKSVMPQLHSLYTTAKAVQKRISDGFDYMTQMASSLWSTVSPFSTGADNHASRDAERNREASGGMPPPGNAHFLSQELAKRMDSLVISWHAAGDHQFGFLRALFGGSGSMSTTVTELVRITLGDGDDDLEVYDLGHGQSFFRQAMQVASQFVLRSRLDAETDRLVALAHDTSVVQLAAQSLRASSLGLTQRCEEQLQLGLGVQLRHTPSRLAENAGKTHIQKVILSLRELQRAMVALTQSDNLPTLHGATSAEGALDPAIEREARRRSDALRGIFTSLKGLAVLLASLTELREEVSRMKHLKGDQGIAVAKVSRYLKEAVVSARAQGFRGTSKTGDGEAIKWQEICAVHEAAVEKACSRITDAGGAILVQLMSMLIRGLSRNMRLSMMTQERQGGGEDNWVSKDLMLQVQAIGMVVLASGDLGLRNLFSRQ